MEVTLTTEELDLIALAMFVLGNDLESKPQNFTAEVEDKEYTLTDIERIGLGLIDKLYPELQDDETSVSA